MLWRIPWAILKYPGRITGRGNLWRIYRKSSTKYSTGRVLKNLFNNSFGKSWRNSLGFRDSEGIHLDISEVTSQGTPPGFSSSSFSRNPPDISLGISLRNYKAFLNGILGRHPGGLYEENSCIPGGKSGAISGRNLRVKIRGIPEGINRKISERVIEQSQEEFL